jgi:beta-galactosidase
MNRSCFNQDWKVKKENAGHTPPNPVMEITLPHDVLFESVRDNDAWNGTKKGFYSNGVWEYTKQFEVPENWRGRHVLFEFEGVYNRSMVYINDGYAGQRPYGYSEFYIDADNFLRYGQTNTIKVVARTGDDSRWYSGAGIYRNVNLLLSDLIHIPANGVRVTTETVTQCKAVITIETKIMNLSHSSDTVRVQTEVYAPDGTLVGADTAPVTLGYGEAAAVNQRVCLQSPQLWSVGRPVLYICKTTLLLADIETDAAETRFGIRVLTLDSFDGLQINGESVKLRGCCIHHDNGVIGARTFAAAEYRKVKKLKESGFNAIRSAHHPASRALLNACDELGMLVMDEAFDMWAVCKSSDDYSFHFPEWWERDVVAMVEKDFNHPSVILYSIGNEIPDVSIPHGAKWGRMITEKIKSLDITRFTTNSINGFLCILDKLQDIMAKRMQEAQATGKDINATMSELSGQGMDFAARIPEVDAATEESFATVDVAGYNYMMGRYETDHELHPNRVIVGSETFTAQIPQLWEMVKNHPYIIGDFAWTGWDYLGETGIGRVSYTERNIHEGFYGEYPWTTAWCGDIDITGCRLPASFYREIVYGLRSQPYIAVLRPEHYHETPHFSPWSFSDAINSWSFNGFEGKPVRIEVYSDAEEIALYLNGKEIGRKKIGEARAFTVEFETVYQPGKLEAVAFTNGKETGRYSLESAGANLRLHIVPENTHIKNNGQDLAFINISITDENGIIHTHQDRPVKLTVEGAGSLIGFGSGSPEVTESYIDKECTTYNGRVLAVLLPMCSGSIKVVAEAEGCNSASAEILIQE